MHKRAFKISVTTLEKFRRYMVGASPFDTEAALMEVLRGIFYGTDLTRTGAAFHSIIERPTLSKVAYCYDEQWRVAGKIGIPEKVAQLAFRYSLLHPQAIYEVPVSGFYELDNYIIQVSGRLDSSEALHLRDVKLKFRRLVNLNEYIDSLQWRFYLDLMGVDNFYYDLYEAPGFSQLAWGPDGVRYAVGLEVEEVDPLHCFRYNGMRTDLLYWLDQFMQYIEARNIDHLLKPADETSKA